MSETNLLTDRDEAGAVVCESMADERGWISLDAARKAVAAYDQWAAETPRKYEPTAVRLAIGPVIDKHIQSRPVGWYIDFKEEF